MSSYLKWSSGSWAILSNVFYLEEQTEADPLIVSDISPLLWVYRLVDAGVSNINTCTVTITLTMPAVLCAVRPPIRFQKALGMV